MRILATLTMLLAMALPSWAATTWPAGTNTPNQTFYGNQTFKSNLVANGSVTISTTSTNPLTVNTNWLVVANGNVGIGIASPNTKLSVVTPYSALNTLYPIITAQYGGSTLSGMYSVADGTDLSGELGLAFMTFQQSVGYGEKLRISNNGNVGIGTTAPLNTLSVNGDIGAKDLFLTNVLSATSLATDSSGKVIAGGVSNGLPAGLSFTNNLFTVSGNITTAAQTNRYYFGGTGNQYVTGDALGNVVVSGGFIAPGNIVASGGPAYGFIGNGAGVTNINSIYTTNTVYTINPSALTAFLVAYPGGVVTNQVITTRTP
jgi:hypothetical protein